MLHLRPAKGRTMKELDTYLLSCISNHYKNEILLLGITGSRSIRVEVLTLQLMSVNFGKSLTRPESQFSYL